MTGPIRQQEHFTRWPKYRAMYIRAFDEMLNERYRRGLETTWRTGEEVMAWWLKEEVRDVHQGT
jgi:phosphoadenosine phosphosulfate reductase